MMVQRDQGVYSELVRQLQVAWDLVPQAQVDLDPQVNLLLLYDAILAVTAGSMLLLAVQTGRALPEDPIQQAMVQRFHEGRQGVVTAVQAVEATKE